MTDKKVLWDRAGKAGLALGAVSVSYTLITYLIGLPGSPGALGAFFISLLNVVLWIAKFAGCILLLRFFMKAFARAERGADNSDVFRFGIATALLSAVIVAAFSLAFYSFIQPDVLGSVMDALAGNPALDSAGLEALEQMAPKLPTIMFFSQLSYCFLYGLALSAILSRNIPPRNPFADGADEQ